MGDGGELRIREIRLEQRAAGQRSVADVEGQPLWFESPDAELRASAEAFACALLPSALARGDDLVVEAPLDPVFSENVARVAETFARWWRYPQIGVRSESDAGAAGGAAVRGAPARGETALCFSGGADSFYSLLCGEEKIDALVFVHAFDLDLADAKRAEAWCPRVERIAETAGARPIWIRTNLREHPVSDVVPWGRAHGGGMAAVGHALAGVSRLVVAASYPTVYLRPWGSRWDVDPYWSAADTTIVHHGANQWRADKIRMLAHQSLAQAHLRVCLAPPGDALNCSRCEKCVRTMLVLAQCGVLERFATLDRGASLAERVAGLGRLSPGLGPVYAGFFAREADPGVRDALRELLARSQGRERRGLVHRAWKRVRRAARRAP